MTRWCVLCASEYVEGVAECVECLVPVTGGRPLRVDEVGAPDEDQIAYDLDELDATERFEIDRALARQGVAHAWDEASLVVREADEDLVDRLVDTSDAAAALEGRDQVAYDLSDWSDDQRGEVVEALALARIAHGWEEGGDLVVAADDEERVEAVLDAIEFPDQLPVEDADDDDAPGGGGLAAHEAMGELFVAADRLMHDPSDHEGVLALVDAARMAESLPVPYGFAPAGWRDLVGQATALRRALEGDADDDEVVDLASSLRTVLRQYV